MGPAGIEGEEGGGGVEEEEEEDGEVIKLVLCYPSTHKARCLIPIISINMNIKLMPNTSI
jgi:hypothetical protein